MRRHPAAARRGVLILLSVTAVLIPASAATARANSPSTSFQPPVQAPVIEGYSAPSDPYAVGNRGIEYATSPGTTVVAAGAGLVIFAGVIAGASYVTIQHANGIRTSYSYLATILVKIGSQVAGGDPVGLAGPIFQIGARRGVVYFDPATLWSGRPHVFLVPLAGRPVAMGDPYADAETPYRPHGHNGGTRFY